MTQLSNVDMQVARKSSLKASQRYTDRRRGVALLAAAIGLVAAVANAVPQPGTLDQAFGENGVVITAIPDGAIVKELFVLAEGKILAVGGFSRDSTIHGIAVARYLADGTLDPSFGQGGVSTIEVSELVEATSFGMESAALLVDGQIVVQGTLWSDPVTLSGQVLIRLHSDGTLDTDFGTGGIVETSFAGLILDLAIDGEGRWVGTGFDSSDDYAVLTARFLANGELDTSFGNDGLVTTDFSSRPDQGHGVLPRPDGKTIVASSVAQGGSAWDFAALRLLESGELDPTFGDGGRRTIAFGPDSYDYSRVSTVAPDGKILIGGESSAGGWQRFGVARLLENGDLDPSFGQSGTVNEAVFSLESTMGAGLAIDAEGRILAGGTAYAGFSFSGFLLAAWTTNGELDTNFGDGGAAMPELPGDLSSAAAMAVQPDGKILLAGIADHSFAIVRYHGAAVIFADGFESGDISAWSSE